MPLGEGGPKAHRLGHDILAIKGYWLRVFHNQGRNTQHGIKGHRGKEMRELAKQGKVESAHGGPRKKGAGDKNEEDTWWHPDAKGAYDAIIEISRLRYEAGKPAYSFFL